jgi:hypothetical protein
MRLGAIILAIFGAALASSETMAITTYSSSPLSKMIVTATVPDRNDAPLYFTIREGILQSGNMRGVAPGDGMYYQSSGTAEIKSQEGPRS